MAHFWWEPYVPLGQIVIIAFTAGAMLAKVSHMERSIHAIRQNIRALASSVTKMVIAQGLQIEVLPDLEDDDG